MPQVRAVGRRASGRPDEAVVTEAGKDHGMLDPTKMKLDPARLAVAIELLNERLASASPPDPDVQYAADDLPNPSRLQDLFGEYDYGEPLWNGALMFLAKQLLVAPMTTVEIESIEELGQIDMDEVGRFHHGDVICKGDLGIFESMWITGNLHVAGSIQASYLDAFSDLFVGGNVKCRSAEMMGLSLVFGTLDVQDLAYIWSQGENWVLGGVRGGALVGEYGSVEEMDGTQVEHHFDVEDLDIETVAAKLGTSVHKEDDSPYDVISRRLYGEDP